MTGERLDAFMARANAAYYATRDPFADFTTSPEITQVFGEIVGLWAAVVWQSMGSPAPVLLVEAGPGRGTLMADALRAISARVPAFRAALTVHLIETSPRLREAQARAIGDATWHDDLATLPEAPALVIANEFLDALPIRQFVRRGDGWAERYVSGARWVECPPDPTDAWPADGPHDAPEGSVVEQSVAARDVVASLSRRLAAQGGAALIIDYGPERSAAGESLQALRDGRPADPLGAPGAADLTAHVDFAALASVARRTGMHVHGPVPQGIFLARLGLFQRTGVLARTQPPARAAALIEAARRLAEPDRMGRLFKAMAICHPDVPAPPGFAA